VPVITDPEWKDGARRNPEMWDVAEKWKDAPRNSQIFWVVSPDQSVRSGLYYQNYSDPALLHQWLTNILILDGRVEDATAKQKHGAVLQHNHTALHSAWRWRGEGSPEAAFHQLGAKYKAAAGRMTAVDLCSADEVDAMLKTLRLDPPARRAELREEIGAWLDAWARRTADGDTEKDHPWLRQLHAWHKADTLGDTITHEMVARLLRKLSPPE